MPNVLVLVWLLHRISHTFHDIQQPSVNTHCFYRNFTSPPGIIHSYKNVIELGLVEGKGPDCTDTINSTQHTLRYWKPNTKKTCVCWSGPPFHRCFESIVTLYYNGPLESPVTVPSNLIWSSCQIFECMYLIIYIYIHQNINTHTHIHTYIHTYIHT